MTMRALNMSGHTQVTAQLAMDMDIPEAARLAGATVKIELSAERITDMRNALQRALNTSPESPQWLFDLCDICDAAHGIMPVAPMKRPADADQRLAA